MEQLCRDMPVDFFLAAHKKEEHFVLPFADEEYADAYFQHMFLRLYGQKSAVFSY